MSPRFRTTTLDDIDPIAVAGVHWQPVRRTLGIGAFGINAYTAAKGERVVEEHDERNDAGDGGHEELYVVVAGHARFTIDGEDVDAPQGTLIFLPEPAAHRGAVAVADGTTVLAIGADPDRPFTVSEWEDRFVAEGTPVGRRDDAPT